MQTQKSKLKIWEIALLLALCVTLFTGLWAQAASSRLSGALVRLHVVAESDSERDQAVKLKVRDAVLEYLEPRLRGAKTAAAARRIIENELETLRRIAEEVTAAENAACAVSASIGTESFPTRDYETFSLPAGDYVSLRLTLGEGGGKNWWCVIFPPLCVNSVETQDAFDELSPENAGLITTENGEYTLRFHILEFFERIRHAFS